MKSISLLSVSLLNEDLISNLIKSCEKFKPKDLTINYIVVENSKETSYKDRVCSISPNVTWVQNSIQDKLSAGAGTNHGLGLNVGMKYVNDDWVLVCDPNNVPFLYILPYLCCVIKYMCLCSKVTAQIYYK